jgi:hypothetical protein
MDLTTEQKEILQSVAPWALSDTCASYTSDTLRRRLGFSRPSSLYRYLTRNGIETYYSPRRRLVIPRLAIVAHILRLNGSPVSQ